MIALMAAAGGIVAAGLVMLVAALRPPRANLAVAIGRYQVDQARLSRTPAPRTAAADSGGSSWTDRAGGWLARLLERREVDLVDLRADLAICDRTLERHLAQTITAAATGLMIPAVIGTLAITVLGVGITPVVPAVASLAVAGVLALVTTTQLRAEARERRTELRWALASYLDLVAMSLAAGAGIAQALPDAARVGRGWAFELISRTIERAALSGVPVGRAVRRLGEDYAVPELVELGAQLTLTGSEGAQARESLGTRAQGLREKRLTDDEGKAGELSQSMLAAQMLLAIAFILFLAYPAIGALLAL